MLTAAERMLVSVAVGSRALIVGVAVAACATLRPFDASTQLLLQPALNDHSRLSTLLASALGSWDVHHFIGIASNGRYVYEHQLAFFPLLPWLSRWMATIAGAPNDHISLVLAGVLLSNVAFIFSIVLLYRLTRLVYPHSEAVAILSCVLFMLSPANIFLCAAYTESIFTCLSFLGMYLLECGHDYLAALGFMMAGLTRSNGIFYVGFFLYKAILSKTMKQMIHSTICIYIVLLPFIAVQVYAYTQFCLPEHTRPWCQHTIPIAYVYVQEHYWNNGFLRYWRVSQIPNFIVATPVWVFSSTCLYGWFKQQPIINIMKSMLNIRSTIKLSDSLQPVMTLLPYMVLHLVMLLYTTTNMHIQVLVRFTTSLPTMYWLGAHLYVNDNKIQLLNGKISCARVWVTYCTVYSLVGACLFALFYPPA